jgi:SAM-dependent methyltransferase
MRNDVKQNAKKSMPRDRFSRSLWDYFHSREIAVHYDSYFSDNVLFKLDTEILDEIFEKPGRLLDLGCGTARHLIHFASRGFEVTGVDLSEEMLAVARSKMARAGVRADLIHADITDLAALPDGAFDYAISMFSTIGMLRSAGRLAAIREARKKLKRGGLLAVHVHNRFFDTLNLGGIYWLIGSYLRGLIAPGFEIGDKVFPNYRGVRGMRLHLFSLRETEALLKRAGFSIERVFYINEPRNAVIPPSPLARLRSNGFILIAKK